IWLAQVFAADPLVAWEDRRGLQQIAAEILTVLPDDEDQIVYVLGEPGLYFHLASQSSSPRRAILPAGDLASLDIPPEALQRVTIYALMRPHVDPPDADPTAGVTWAESHARPVRQWPWRPSTLVRLNHSAPAHLDELPEQTMRLLQIAE